MSEVTQKIMDALDAVSGSAASAYVKIGGKRYCMMQLYKFEAKVEVQTSDVAILGRRNKGTKPSGWKGTWSGTAHYNQSVLRQLLLEYEKNGKLTRFDIQITNEDPTASVGRQTIVLKDCLTKGGILAKFDASSDSPLEEDLEGTFEAWDMPEKFSLLAGMTDLRTY